MKAFHGSEEVKKKYIDRVRAHREADNLIRGQGWDGKRGCAVGCTLEKYDHKAFAEELGIPEWLAHLEDRIFENCSFDRHQSWPEEFLSAVPVGADLEKIKGPFLIAVLERVKARTDDTKSLAVIDRAIALWSRTDIGSDDFLKEADAYAAYATDAAYAARAARAARAGYAADAADAADAAGYAAAAADAAGYAARAAAYAAAAADAADAAEWDWIADKLLELLREAR